MSGTTLAPTPPPILASCPYLAHASGPRPLPSLRPLSAALTAHPLSDSFCVTCPCFHSSTFSLLMCLYVSPDRDLNSVRVGGCVCVSCTSVTPAPTTAVAQSSVQLSRSGLSDSLRPHGLQHARPPCPSPTPRVYPNACALSQ